MESEVVTIDGEQFLLVHPPQCPYCNSGNTVWDEDGGSVICKSCNNQFKA